MFGSNSGSPQLTIIIYYITINVALLTIRIAKVMHNNIIYWRMHGIQYYNIAIACSYNFMICHCCLTVNSESLRDHKPHFLSTQGLVPDVSQHSVGHPRKEGLVDLVSL